MNAKSFSIGHDFPAALANRPLVGISYFAGWWPEKPNKWQTPGTQTDWREQFPERIPLLGEYNSQETMDLEIAAAADHGVDFWLMLWYPPCQSDKESSPRLARGLEYFLASPHAGRMGLMLEFCNHPPFHTPTDAEWDACINALMPALKHPSAMRVGGRLVFKIHSSMHFLKDCGENLQTCEARLGRLRAAVRDAGLGEMAICGGGLGLITPDIWPKKVFDFTADYMLVPPQIVPAPVDHPFAALADFLRDIRQERQAGSLPFMPVTGAGWNPKPWRDPRPCFAFPNRSQWTAELRRMNDDLNATGNLGIPRPDGSVAKAFTIYAWNEFGEGGFVAPTRGDQYMKLESIREVFGKGGSH